MVLDHVADRARLVVERAASVNAEVLGHCDLHAFHEFAIPERLEECIRKAEEDHVVHRPLAEVVIDAKYMPLVERGEQDLVQLARGFEIVSEWLFDDYPRTPRAARPRKLLDHVPQQRGRNGKV